MWPQPNTVRAPGLTNLPKAGECGGTSRDPHHAIRIEKPGPSQAQPGPGVLPFLIQELNVLSKTSGLKLNNTPYCVAFVNREKRGGQPWIFAQLEDGLPSVSSGDSLIRGAE